MKIVSALGVLLGLLVLVDGCSEDSSSSSPGSTSGTQSACEAFYSQAQACGSLSAGELPSCKWASGSPAQAACDLCFYQTDCNSISESFCAADQTLAACLDFCEGRFDCGDEGNTVPVDMFCDGKSDCFDGRDEPEGCTPAVESSAEYTCSDGAKILADQVCDSNADCSDGGDEAGCAAVVCPNFGG